ncbi:hypothetical protein AB0B66_31705 [Catellatospora sp. NPDC049111]|uniref:hypothetical protein n=1 Tax=Catellatospora sp. NPDC049111 TaxID=3155271 RepID=UPI0033F1CB2A
MERDTTDVTVGGLLKASGVVEVSSPLDVAALKQDLPAAHLIQFNDPLTDDDFGALGELTRSFPDVELRAYGVYGPVTLDFLRHLPQLRRLSLDQHCLTDVSALSELLPDLQSLVLGETHGMVDLRPLRLRGLRRLGVAGHRRGLAELVNGNPDLRSLSLRGLPVDQLLGDVELPNLEELNLRLGSINELSWVCRFQGLRQLMLWRVRGVADLDALARLPELRWLWLDTLKAVERMPDFSASRNLFRIDLDNLSSMRTEDALAGLARAEGLEELGLYQGRIPVTALRALVGHPRLKRVALGLGSARRNREASTVIDLPSPISVYAYAQRNAVY